jgi:hypothetical protein
MADSVIGEISRAFSPEDAHAAKYCRKNTEYVPEDMISHLMQYRIAFRRFSAASAGRLAGRRAGTSSGWVGGTISCRSNQTQYGGLAPMTTEPGGNAMPAMGKKDPREGYDPTKFNPMA